MLVIVWEYVAGHHDCFRGLRIENKYACQVTEGELAATRAVVTEQTATEANLRSEAGQTKRSLELAETDVEGLRAKVARQVCTNVGCDTFMYSSNKLHAYGKCRSFFVLKKIA